MNELPGSFRIIGGFWRGRKLPIPIIAGVRPTPDRVRETLFNWLSPYISQAKCLDMFAGSGALGFEALSRGAQHVTFVDQNASVLRHLSHSIVPLQCQCRVKMLHYSWGNRNIPIFPEAPFDVIFLDPPFHQNGIPQLLELLIHSNLITLTTLIYVEFEKGASLPDSTHWEIHRHKIAGNVQYGLVRKKCS